MPELEKIFEGSSIQANLIRLALEQIGIEPIIKDRTESGRLAGFASEIPMQVEMYVFESQYDDAVEVLKNLSLEG
ncbi:putative signal transducing protein [Capnocytophaga cynodegmi]|uniref:putative signal transducing protein n=1 Tax=Capnocytophaga cynodegmi TaxID=28189 RepID=UPI00385D972D